MIIVNMHPITRRVKICDLRCAIWDLGFANCDSHDNFAGMQIMLNNEPMTLDGDTITVAKLLELKKYTFRLRIVKINGRIIDRDSYDREMINEGDTVQVIYLMSGG